jgi:hypothetical protein
MGYIKSNITLNYFMDTNFEKVVRYFFCKCNNHIDLLTKLLPLAIFYTCAKNIDIKRHKRFAENLTRLACS